MEQGAESDPGPETGLEESVWRLGLESYPERSDEPDCIYYLRTGYCGYGSRCRFNHPRDRAAVLGVARAGSVEYPERVGQPLCQYYVRNRTCKFGTSCKYHHPRQGGGSVSPLTLNYYGYPLRLGEKECSYYVETGQCKFGSTCKFHHPEPPPSIQVPVPSPASLVAPMPAPLPAPTLYPAMHSPSGPSSQQYGVVVARPPLLQASYVQGPYGAMLLSPGMVPLPSWSPYLAPVNPGTQPSIGSTSIYGITSLSPSAPAYTGTYQPVPSSVGPSSSSQKEQPFPERPGQPECQYYMKTGDCKFGSSCRYHHPPEVIAPKSNVYLNPIGLPQRPLGPAGKFDHSMGTLCYSPSASSHADMPVAPYPVGYSVGTLAPSSSSSDLRPELISGCTKDAAATRISSSVGASNESVSSVFSRSRPLHLSSNSQSGKSCTPTGDGNSSAEQRT